MVLRCSQLVRNVHDPVFMRNVKKAFSKYQTSMDRTPKRAVSREAFMDMDDKGAAWYLGHMASATTEMEQKISTVDFVLEMRDARLPFTTENPTLRKLIRGRPHLIIFNKAEMAHQECNVAVQRFYESQGSFALFTSTRRTWRDTVEAVRRFVSTVIPQQQYRTTAQIGLVVGMPNVGKSSLINSLRMSHEYQFHKDDFHRSRTGQTVSVHPGTTRSLKMVPVCKDPNVVLYDSPGLTLPGCFAKEAGLKLAACGIVPTNDLTLTRALVARYLYDVLAAAGVTEHLAECLNLPRSPVSFDDCMALICERSGRSAQTELGNLQPFEAQGFLIHDFQSGRLGRITLDRLPNRVKTFVSEPTDAFKIGSGQEHAEESDDVGQMYTHHVETHDATPPFPEHLRAPLEELHFGGRPPHDAPEATAGRAKAPGPAAKRDVDAFVISRKRGVISRATHSDEGWRNSTRLRPGR